MQKTILVLLTENAEWMNEAIHQAAQLARRTGYPLAVLKMIPVQHTSWLASAPTYIEHSDAELKILKTAQATAEDYGVEICMEPFQYVTLPEAIYDAAMHYQAAVLYATLPTKWLEFWRQHKINWLNRALAEQHVQLNTLEAQHHKTEAEPQLSAAH
ncbi:MAG: universal stress protein [Anaerolineae bacterium]|nr:universal stress protein [Anaerolineae bacterium]